MSDWRAELERERHMVPTQPARGACQNGPSACYERYRRRQVHGRCQKIQFQSETVARNFAWLLELRDDIHMDLYECGYCDPGTWHVTSNGRAKEDAA